jgi:hypothetical protein
MQDSYDDDDYDDNDYEHPKNDYQHYFKFDPTAWDALTKFFTNAFKDIIDTNSNTWYIYGYPNDSFPVNSYFPSTGKKNNFQYLGTNYDGVKIWKKQYFIIDPIQTMYINHIQTHAIYFIKQPHYYKGLFDILN